MSSQNSTFPITTEDHEFNRAHLRNCRSSISRRSRLRKKPSTRPAPRRVNTDSLIREQARLDSIARAEAARKRHGCRRGCCRRRPGNECARTRAERNVVGNMIYFDLDESALTEIPAARSRRKRLSCSVGRDSHSHYRSRRRARIRRVQPRARTSTCSGSEAIPGRARNLRRSESRS